MTPKKGTMFRFTGSESVLIVTSTGTPRGDRKIRVFFRDIHEVVSRRAGRSMLLTDWRRMLHQMNILLVHIGKPS